MNINVPHERLIFFYIEKTSQFTCIVRVIDARMNSSNNNNNEI